MIPRGLTAAALAAFIAVWAVAPLHSLAEAPLCDCACGPEPVLLAGGPSGGDQPDREKHRHGGRGHDHLTCAACAQPAHIDSPEGADLDLPIAVSAPAPCEAATPASFHGLASIPARGPPCAA